MAFGSKLKVKKFQMYICENKTSKYNLKNDGNLRGSFMTLFLLF